MRRALNYPNQDSSERSRCRPGTGLTVLGILRFREDGRLKAARSQVAANGSGHYLNPVLYKIQVSRELRSEK